jgi:hypothetical protein
VRGRHRCKTGCGSPALPCGEIDAQPPSPPWPGLLLFDGNPAFADLDLDAAGLLILVVHVAENCAADGDYGNDDVERIAGHDDNPVGGTKGAVAGI